MTAPRGRGRGRAPAGDAGMTLVDLVVSMSIMSVFMAMFTVGILQLYRSVGRDQAIATAQSSVNTAFVRLDKQIRYAAGLTTPGLVGATDTYVEYLITNTGTPYCTQLRVHVTTLQTTLERRTWLVPAGAAPIVPTAWIPLMSDVSVSEVSATQPPFTFIAATSTFPFQRLRVALDATSSASGEVVRKQFDVTFTAMNTSLRTTASTCSNGRSIP